MNVQSMSNTHRGNVKAEYLRKSGAIMYRVLTTGSYGISLFSFDTLQGFLQKEKVRSKKLLEKFQKDPDFYLAAIKEGVWIPFVQINSIDYLIKLAGCGQPFDDQWEQKMKYSGFNLDVKDSLWITDIGSFFDFDKDRYIGKQERSYQTADGETLYSDFKYNVPSGKYTVSITGYARRNQLGRLGPNYGFSFSLTGVDEFVGFNNPRENELYDFNVANM
jgi:hypothetical protein